MYIKSTIGRITRGYSFQEFSGVVILDYLKKEDDHRQGVLRLSIGQIGGIGKLNVYI